MKRLLQSVFFTFLFAFQIFPQSPVVQQILNSVSQDSLVYFVRELSGNVPTIINGTSQTIVSRHKNQPGNSLAETYIKQKLENYGLTTTIQSFSTTGKNVLGVKTGTEFPNQKYIICAHYDDMPSGTTAPGADDNASGTSAVIEAARVLKNYSFPFTIVFALWDEEEQGLIGSEYYATQAANAGDSILGVVNMDMIAYDGNNDGNADVHNSSIANTGLLKDKMLEVNLVYGINLDLDVVPAEPYSDHQSFLDHGYGAILIIEDDNDFHPYYHTVNDLVIHFNNPYYLKMSRLAIGTLVSFALNLNLTIQHSPIASTDISQPINTSAFISTGLTIGTGSAAPRLYYRTKTGGGSFSQFNEIVGTPATLSATYNFTIPAQPLGTVVQYYIAAQDANSSIVTTLPAGGGGYNPPGSTPPLNLYAFYVAPITYSLNDNASTTTNWTISSAWGLATTKFVSPPTSFNESPSGNYTNNLTATLTYSLPIVLDNSLGSILEFDTQWNIETDWDYGQVLISTNSGSTWTPQQGLYTNPGTGSFQPGGQPLYDAVQSTWVTESIDLSTYNGQTILLRFLFRSDGSQVFDGWFIDNIKIISYSSVPVELTSFAAAVINDEVHLNWSTASELNNAGFEVQRSTDENSWYTISYVEGNGTVTSSSHYSVVDKDPVTGISFYRLVQKDFDGTSKIYNSIEVNFAAPSVFALEQNYPNPFNPVTKIQYSIPVKNFVELKVFDLLGGEIVTLVSEEKEQGKHTVDFDGSSFSSGVYYYTIKSGEFYSTKKMILIK
ncbi:MAG: M28 family peptidase [Ignavibacteriales bacterium]|nr:MAG: M28 family peptidase [Ignavibacteriales bacterium]